MAEPVTPPHTCLVFGTEFNDNGLPLMGIVVTARLVASGVLDREAGINSKLVNAVTDVKGYWELNLVPSVDMQDVVYEFTFSDGKSYLKTIKADIPAETEYQFYSQ